MRQRSGSNPKRRIVEAGSIPAQVLAALAERVSYAGSGHHKRNPADYGLERTNPRPTKSLCDKDRVIRLAEAQSLLRLGVLHGLISQPLSDGLPKYVWSVSTTRGVEEVFEAKSHPHTPGVYHGYPLDSEEDMREYVLRSWKERCRDPGK
jgi:hypothetical protein